MKQNFIAGDKIQAEPSAISGLVEKTTHKNPGFNVPMYAVVH